MGVVAQADIVLVEGAGSAAEVNLRANDIANMGFARAAQVPVVLIGDIDRGGVIAALVGTHAVLDAADAAMIGGFIVNRFRGDPALFETHEEFISRHQALASYPEDLRKVTAEGFSHLARLKYGPDATGDPIALVTAARQLLDRLHQQQPA